MKDSLHNITLRLREFARQRDWDQFHSPKNISMALIAEAAEIIEHFQWLSEVESCQLDDIKKQQVALEIADVQIFLVRLADILDIDIIESVEQKIAINETRYPIDKVKGSAKRHNEYD